MGFRVLDPEHISYSEIAYILSSKVEYVLMDTKAIQYKHKLLVSKSAAIRILFDKPNYRVEVVKPLEFNTRISDENCFNTESWNQAIRLISKDFENLETSNLKKLLNIATVNPNT